MSSLVYLPSIPGLPPGDGGGGRGHRRRVQPQPRQVLPPGRQPHAVGPARQDGVQEVGELGGQVRQALVAAVVGGAPEGDAVLHEEVGLGHFAAWGGAEHGDLKGEKVQKNSEKMASNQCLPV